MLTKFLLDRLGGLLSDIVDDFLSDDVVRWSTTRLITDKTDEDTTDVRARVNVRKFQSQNNGKVKFRVGWASIKYNATRVDCDFPDDIDLTLDDNDPSVSLTNSRMKP